ILTPIWVLSRERRMLARGLLWWPSSFVRAAVSTLAFVAWAFALEEPFSSLKWHNPESASLVLFVFTLLSGFLVPNVSPFAGRTKVISSSFDHSLTADDYFDRVTKYFPVETIVVWIAFSGMIRTPSALWVLFGLLTILSPVLMQTRHADPGQR